MKNINERDQSKGYIPLRLIIRDKMIFKRLFFDIFFSIIFIYFFNYFFVSFSIPINAVTVFIYSFLGFFGFLGLFIFRFFIM